MAVRASGWRLIRWYLLIYYPRRMRRKMRKDNGTVAPPIIMSGDDKKRFSKPESRSKSQKQPNLDDDLK